MNEWEARQRVVVALTTIRAASMGAIPQWVRYVPDAPRQMSYTVNVRDAIVSRIPSEHLRSTYSVLHPVTGDITTSDD